MKIQNIVATLLCLSLILFSATAGHAQVTPPAPDKTASELIAILDSDGSDFEKAKACQQLAIIGDATAVPPLAALLSSERLSTYARSALENLGVPEATQALMEACESLTGNQRLGAVQSLAKRKDPTSFPTFVKLIEADNPPIQIAAARAIGDLGTIEAAEKLRSALENAPENLRDEMAQACLICAQRLVSSGKNEQAILMCQKIIDANPRSDIASAASQQLILARGKGGRDLVLKLMASGDPVQIQTALYAARRMPANLRPTSELAAMLETQSPGNQVLILELLADIGDHRILPAVLKSAQCKEPLVRVTSIEVLAKLGDETCLPTLFEAAKSTDTSVVNAALSTITSIDGNEIDATVLEMLGDQDNRALSAAIEIAAGRRIGDAVPRLMELAMDPNQQFRKRAIHAIGQAASAEHFPQLMELMTRTMDDRRVISTVKPALQSALLRMPQEDCARKLTNAMTNATPAAQIVLLEQLAAIGGPTALNTVVSAARSNVDPLRDAATRVLGEWLTADAAPEIFELVKTLPKGKYQTRMLRGYIRIARQLDMSMDERMEVCRNALAVADRKDEKVLILAVLRRYRSLAGIDIANSLLNQPGLRRQAQATIDRIRQDLDGKDEAGFVSLFDGKTLNGWKEHTVGFWRVEDGAIVGGDLTKKVKQNEFLRSQKKYGDFELRLQFKLVGDKTNAGVQFRTAEIPGDHEVSGYQADLGDGWWGCLYDESRRRKVLAGPPTEKRAEPVHRDQWNEYRIRCEGKRIQLWINEIQTVDYTEPDPDIPQTGIIALQVHGNLINEAHYRKIRIKPLR